MTPRTIHEQLEASKAELRQEVAAMEARLDDPTLTLADRAKLKKQASYARETLTGESDYRRQVREEHEASKARVNELLRDPTVAGDDRKKLLNIKRMWY
jgi:hypothetical protein